MSVQEHSVITFLKKHGKEIIERERQKYEPIKQEHKEEINKISEDNDLEELRKENIKLKTNTNMEWFNKYKFYKNKYKTQKKELKQTKLELIQVREEIENIRDEIKQLKIELNNIKGKGKLEIKDEIQKYTESSETEEEMEPREVNYIKESDNDEQDNIIQENKEILTALGKMKNVNAILEEEEDKSDLENSLEEEETNNRYNEEDTEDIVNEDAEEYPEEEIRDNIITRRDNNTPYHLPIGQQEEVQNFIGSVTQGININGYFLDIDNAYDEQEISRRIKDWNLGMYIALMNSKNMEDLDYVFELISKTIIGKAAFWLENIAYELKQQSQNYAHTWKDMLNMFDIVLKREFLGERWFVAQDQVIAERKIEIVMNLNNMKCCKINKLPEYTISFTKFFYEARFLPQESIVYQQLYYDHLPTPYNTEISKEYANLEPKENTLGERIRLLRAYLMRKCEEYRVQQKIKKDKKRGLREICGFTERKLIFGCDNKYNKQRKYKKYNKKPVYNNQDKYYKNKSYRPYRPFRQKYKRRRFRRYKNTPENRKRFRFKRKFRKRRYIKPLQGENNNKIKDCKCWNCNEKGHYANKCPKLKQKGVKYVDNTEFIMNLEYIKEEDNNWYNDDEFYISETEPEDIKYMEEMK